MPAFVLDFLDPRARCSLSDRGMEVARDVAMLRITPLAPVHEVRRLKLEGRLIGDWVEVLKLEIERAQGEDSELELELAGVEFADSEALTLLLAVADQGVRLVGCSPLLTSLLESKAS